MKFPLILSATISLLIGLAACAPGPSPSDEAVTLIIRFEASERGEEEFADIMRGVSDAMASEPGFVSANVYRDVEEPQVFILEEVWASRESHQAHFARINQSGDWSHINSLLIEEPEMGYYRAM